jgi:hypothetical protein
MPYVTDGSPHHSGVATEVKIVELINNNPEIASICAGRQLEKGWAKQIGGTRYKQDVEVYDYNMPNYKKHVSAKNKENIDSGSFDWINSSRAYKNWLQECCPALNQAYDRAKTRKDSVEFTRKNLNAATNESWNNIPENVIQNLIREWISEPNKDMRMVILEKKNKTVFGFDFRDTKLYKYASGNAKITLSGRGKTSRKVLFDGEDTGLRMRITTNNGVKALLGLSKSNNSSQLVVKFQQDKVRNLLERTENVNRICYK